MHIPLDTMLSYMECDGWQITLPPFSEALLAKYLESGPEGYKHTELRAVAGRKEPKAHIIMIDTGEDLMRMVADYHGKTLAEVAREVLLFWLGGLVHFQSAYEQGWDDATNGNPPEKFDWRSDINTWFANPDNETHL